jgi:hypothetical protein
LSLTFPIPKFALRHPEQGKSLRASGCTTRLTQLRSWSAQSNRRWTTSVAHLLHSLRPSLRCRRNRSPIESLSSDWTMAGLGSTDVQGSLTMITWANLERERLVKSLRRDRKRRDKLWH